MTQGRTEKAHPRILAWATGLWCLLAAAAPAHAADALIEGGRLCTQQFPVQEQKYHIPTHLLAAISTTESGRFHKGLGIAVPWPWTINVNGKGYYFSSKAEAIAQTRNLLAQGNRSIDVGCMQVNLKHHAKAFSSLEEAFEPETNVAYAAKFLRDNYADLGDWIKATAAYHSRTQVYGARYLVQIEKSWNSIVAKVAAARASQGKPAAIEAGNKTPLAPPQAGEAKPKAAMSTGRQAPSPAVRTMQASRHERVIKVNDNMARRSSEILVIRGATTSRETPPPEPVRAAPEPVHVVPVQGTAAAVGERAQREPEPLRGDSVRRVTLDNPAGEAQPAPNRFVFTN